MCSKEVGGAPGNTRDNEKLVCHAYGALQFLRHTSFQRVLEKMWILDFLNKQVWKKWEDERQTGCWIVIIMGHSLMKILFRIVLSNIYQLCTIQVRWLPKGYTSTFNCLHSTFGEQFKWQSSNVESSKYFLFLQESLDTPSLHIITSAPPQRQNASYINESITYQNCVFQHSNHWSHLTSLRLMQGVSPRDKMICG